MGRKIEATQKHRKQSQFKEVLFLIRKELNSLKIPFVLFGGTCLGLIRYGGIAITGQIRNGEMGTDSDVDIVVLEEHINRHGDIVKALEKHGYHLHEDDWKSIDPPPIVPLKELPPIYSKMIHMRKKGYLHIDVLYLFKHENLRWHVWTNEIYGLAAYPAEWFEKPLEIEYCGAKFYLPKSPEEFLADEYGDWKNPRPSGALSNMEKKSLWRARKIDLFEAVKKCLKS